MIFVGDDWAEAHHDVHVMNDAGERLARRRLPEGLDGIAAFHGLIADHIGDPAEVVVGIETDRGMWVQTLVAAGYQVFAINPLAVSRYRDRHSVSGAKSDAGDARCSPTWCAPTATITDRWRATPSRPKGSRCSPGVIRI